MIVTAGGWISHLGGGGGGPCGQHINSMHTSYRADATSTVVTMTAVNSISVAVALVLVAAVSFAAGNVPSQGNANGSAVVLEAIGSLQQSGVFGNNNEMLRRIAYVETRDGTQADAANGGGIWAVSERRFLQTQNLNANVRLPAKLRQIKSAFKIDWLQVQWRDLCVPLYSAIAARLVLYLAPRAIPPANNLEAQAIFWVQYYNPDGNGEDFTSVSSGLQGTDNAIGVMS